MKRQRQEMQRNKKTESDKSDLLLVRSIDVASAAVIVQVW